MNDELYGVIKHPDDARRTDYLYRVSIKCIVMNELDEILLVKESGRDWWDLPGGGMDHGENIKSAIAREMKEEVNLTDDFTYKIVHVDDPKELENIKVSQIRLIFMIKPEIMEFSPGEDGDEVAFMSLDQLKVIDTAEYDYLRDIINDI